MTTEEVQEKYREMLARDPSGQVFALSRKELVALCGAGEDGWKFLCQSCIEGLGEYAVLGDHGKSSCHGCVYEGDSFQACRGRGCIESRSLSGKSIVFRPVPEAKGKDAAPHS